MESRPLALLLSCGQLPWGLVSADSTPWAAGVVGADNVKADAPSTPAGEPGDPAKNDARGFATPPGTAPPAPDNGHLIAGALIVAILVAMIAVVMGIFLWWRWRRASLPLPHWAGRSPFADGDLPDVGADKEPAPCPKWVSVLSLLPWRLSREAERLENAGEPSPGPRQNPDQPLPPGSTCPATAAGNPDPSASAQTALSEEPGGLTDVPLQPDAPEPPALDLPLPPSWLGEADGALAPGEPPCPPPTAETQAPADLSDQAPAEPLPPPPEDLLPR